MDTVERLAEQFELVQELGKGGFAQTLLVRVLDQSLIELYGAREIALKVALAGMSRQVQHEFEVNAAMHLRLRNKECANLVRYLGIAVYRNQVVMAMEYVGGGSLRRRMRPGLRQKPMPLDEALEIAEGFLNGLVVLHEMGIFHRDIKPENILLDGRTAKLCDFGISKELRQNEMATMSVMTWIYCSPEALEGQGSFSTDLWSSAVTIYEMVAGRLPFGDPDTPPARMMELIGAGKINPLAGVDDGLSEFLARALQKRPEDRFASAEEMLAELRRIRKGPEDLVEKEIAVIEAANLPSPQQERRYRELVEEFPRSPRAFQSLGEFYNGCYRFSEAVSAFRLGLACNPREPILHWDLALALKAGGDSREVADSLRRALELGLDPALRSYAEMLLAAMPAQFR